MLGRLKELCELYGVSGNEYRVRKYLGELVHCMADECYVDAMGNLIAHNKGAGPRVMVCAHMDEAGMIIEGVMEDGLLAYATQGIDPRVVVSKRVAVGPNDIPGVIGAKAIHLQSAEDRARALTHRELFVDIGASDKSDALKYVKPGDYVSFTSKWQAMGNNCFCAKAIDDRVGCAILVELLRESYDCDFYAVFTTGQLLGQRGIQAATYRIQPELCLVLDCVGANDSPEYEDYEIDAYVGHGPAVCFMDNGMIVKPELFSALINCAKAHKLPVQVLRGKDINDGAYVSRGLGGCPTASVSVPCRFMYSPDSTASLDDAENALRLVDAFLKDKKFEEVL